ncbi:MAG: cysteine synthase A [Myxococcales bacterium]|nr:cysteine synthase A [Myxococcales bacterium]
MRHRIFEGVWDLVGGTPLVQLVTIPDSKGAKVLAKLESQNPSGSVKDRPAHAMILAAEASGALTPGSAIVEATSGNTGISLAMLAAVRGHRCILVMPEDMSSARQSILRAYGADMVLTPAHDGMRGAVEEAERIARAEGAWMPRQFDNPENPRVHERTTAAEIHEATGGRVDAFVAGVGTGGTLTGVARGLRGREVQLEVHAVEPRASAVLSGGRPGLHAIQGLGAGFVPDVLDRSQIDNIITVSDPEAERMASRLSREEGIYAGPSSGANVHAAVKVAAELSPEQCVVTIVCDTGERYQF